MLRVYTDRQNTGISRFSEFVPGPLLRNGTFLAKSRRFRREVFSGIDNWARAVQPATVPSIGSISVLNHGTAPTTNGERLTMHNALLGWLGGSGRKSAGLRSLIRGRKRRADRGAAGEQLETRCLPAVALVAANGQNVEVSPTVPIYNWGGVAFFWGQQSGTQGFEPWISDGTAAGTMQLADISPGRPAAFRSWKRAIRPRIIRQW